MSEFNIDFDAFQWYCRLSNENNDLSYYHLRKFLRNIKQRQKGVNSKSNNLNVDNFFYEKAILELTRICDYFDIELEMLLKQVS